MAAVEGNGVLNSSIVTLEGIGKIIRGTGGLDISIIEVDGTLVTYTQSKEANLSASSINVNGVGYVHYEDDPQVVIDDLLESEYESEKWAYDLHKNALTKGEVFNEDVINVSLENILSTITGERIFLVNFGTILPLVTFEQLNLESAQDLLNIILRAIRRFEKRITVVTDQVKMDLLPEENALTLIIPYIINRNGLISSFSKKVIL